MRLTPVLFAMLATLACGPSSKKVKAAYDARYSCESTEVRRVVKNLLTEWFGTSRGFNPDWDVAPGLVEWVGVPEFVDETSTGTIGTPLSERYRQQASSTFLFGQPNNRYDRERMDQQESKRKMAVPDRFGHNARPSRKGERKDATLVVFATTEREGEAHRVRLVPRTIEKGVQSGPEDTLPKWAQTEMDELQMAVDKELAGCRVR